MHGGLLGQEEKHDSDENLWNWTVMPNKELLNEKLK